MDRIETKNFILQIVNEKNTECYWDFQYLGKVKRKKRHYTEDQKKYAFEMIEEKGIRATAKVLKVPRRTLQRWCRKYNIYVKRCPDWVFEWARYRRQRRDKWRCRGYY